MEKILVNSVLVTMDVRSLYTNIPNKEGIEAAETTLKRKNIGTRIIWTFLRRLVLTLNNFVFNFQNYLQIKGCAMGTKCAPSHANIFMGMFEERYIYPLIETMSKFYQKNPKKQSNKIPLVLTYNRTLPDVKTATTNNWNLFHINQ